MIRINLLPVRAAKKKESLRFQLTIGGLVTFLVIAITLLLYITFSNEVKAVTNDITRGEQELAALKSKIGELSQIKVQKKLLEDKIKTVEKLQADRTGPVRLLSQLSLSVPEKAWIYSLHEGGGSVKVNGLAAYDDVVADFMRNLDRWKLKNVELAVVARGKTVQGIPSSKNAVNFTLSFTK